MPDQGPQGDIRDYETSLVSFWQQSALQSGEMDLVAVCSLGPAPTRRLDESAAFSFLRNRLKELKAAKVSP